MVEFSTLSIHGVIVANACLFLFKQNKITEDFHSNLLAPLARLNSEINKSLSFNEDLIIEVEICLDEEFFEETDNPDLDYFIEYLENGNSKIWIPEFKINDVLEICFLGFVQIYKEKKGTIKRNIYESLLHSAKNNFSDMKDAERVSMKNGDKIFRKKEENPNERLAGIESETISSKRSGNFECVLCAKEALDGNILVSGSVYHESCYQELLDKVSEFQNDIESYHSDLIQNKSSLDQIIRKIIKSRGAFNKFKAVIGAKYFDKKFLWKEREKKENEINEKEKLIKYLEKQLSNSQEQLNSLHDFWPGYPPDWEDRSDEIKKEREVCEACDEDWKLHVHHKIGIQNGGNHTKENLVLLCEKCHGEIHHIDFSDKEFEFREGVSSFGRKLRLINEAISQNKQIYFNYRKFKGEKSKRTILPEETERIGRSLCVRGFCYLRNEDRIFAVKRMRNIKILIVLGFLVFLFLNNCRTSYTVDSWEGWCSQIQGEDLFEKYNTFSIGFNDTAIREDFIQRFNQIIIEGIEKRYLGGKKSQDDIVVNELVRLKMIGAWREGNNLIVKNSLLIIDQELGIDDFEEWANNFREWLDVENRDKLNSIQFCIYGTINTHFETLILIGPDNRIAKISLEFTRKNELK